MATWDLWLRIAVFGAGGVIFLIVCCITACLCRRRIAKKRIREALRIQDNYMQSGKASVSVTPAVVQSVTPDIVTANPMISVRSQSAEKQNVAEDSDEDYAEKTNSKHKTQHVEQDSISEPAVTNPTHPGILDLSSDVVDTGSNGQHSNGAQSKRYRINYNAEDQGASPMMELNGSVSSHTKPMTSFSPIVVASLDQMDGHLNISSDHAKHSSFVLESDVDYYTTMQQQMNDISVVGSMSMSRHRTGTTSYAQNPSILEDDDDEEDDVEYDYGSQMDREITMTQASRLSSR